MMILKKNQIIVFILALLLVTVGYLGIGKQGYLNSIEVSGVNVIDENEKIGDATFVNAEVALVPNDKKDTIYKNTTTDDDNYFVSSKLQRETMYSQMIESYQKMIDNQEITAEQKSIAQNEIIKLNNEKNAIMIIENLISTKGFKDSIILINNQSVNAVIKSQNLKPEEVAQIQNIISRELNIEVNNIHITTK